MPNTYALWGSCRRKQSSGKCCEKNIKDTRLDAMPLTGNEASDKIQLCSNLLEEVLFILCPGISNINYLPFLFASHGGEPGMESDNDLK